MVFQLVFKCTLPEAVGKDELQKMARKAQVMNKSRDITGVLICMKGAALQVIEGEKETVKSLYDWIRTDSRIANAKILVQRSSDTRQFSDWLMVYQHPDETSEFLELLNNDDTAPLIDIVNDDFAMASYGR